MWFEKLPFWDRIGPAFVMAQVLLLLGIGCILRGWITGDASTVYAGLMPLTPGAFAWFLLWRTYADDGYKEERYGHRPKSDTDA